MSIKIKDIVIYDKQEWIVDSILGGYYFLTSIDKKFKVDFVPMNNCRKKITHVD